MQPITDQPGPQRLDRRVPQASRFARLPGRSARVCGDGRVKTKWATQQSLHRGVAWSSLV
ncbi:MAG: hypothetical protein HYY24_07025 [Verrucomicrobia bacterium]|nr:hypothetical protein [Verrucomicrobiota bacterium]